VSPETTESSLANTSPGLSTAGLSTAKLQQIQKLGQPRQPTDAMPRSLASHFWQETLT